MMKVRGKWIRINPFMPTVPTFAVRETNVSRTENVGTVGMTGLIVGAHYPGPSSSPPAPPLIFFTRNFFPPNFLSPRIWCCRIQPESEIHFCESFASCHVTQLWSLSTKGAGWGPTSSYSHTRIVTQSGVAWGDPTRNHIRDGDLGTLILNVSNTFLI